MEISLRHIGGFPYIIEMTVEDWGTTIKTTVTDLNGRVDQHLIDSLREVAEELEQQNSALDEEARK